MYREVSDLFKQEKKKREKKEKESMQKEKQNLKIPFPTLTLKPGKKDPTKVQSLLHRQTLKKATLFNA